MTTVISHQLESAAWVIVFRRTLRPLYFVTSEFLMAAMEPKNHIPTQIYGLLAINTLS